MHVSARINNMGKKRFSVKSDMKIMLENTFGMNQQNMSFLIFLAIQTDSCLCCSEFIHPNLLPSFY